MKRLIPILAAAALATACSSSSSSTSGSTTGGSTNAATGGTSGSTAGSTASSSSSGGTHGGTTGQTTNGSGSGSGSTGTTSTTATTTASTGTTSTTATTTSGSGSTGTTGTPPANDLCANAIALTPHVPGDTQTVTGDTTDASPDFESTSCLGSGNDVFYTLQLNAEAQVQAVLTPGASGNTSVVSIIPDCQSQELVCDASSTAATATARDLQPGTYIIVANNYGSSNGPFSLTVTLSTPVPLPPGDLCSSAIALTVHQPGDTQTVSGDTTNASPDFDSTNCGGGGNDVFYALHLTADSKVVATLTPGTTGNTSVVSIIPACGSQELVCDSSTTAAIASADDLVAGDYFIVADNFSGDNGPYTLQVDLSTAIPPPPPAEGENCAALDAGSEIVLGANTDGGQIATLSFDTTTYADDSQSSQSGACGGSGFGGDRVYHLHLANAVPSLSATIDPNGGPVHPVVYIRDSPCQDVPSTSTELACDKRTDGGAATATATNLQPGDYYIWADEYAGTEGAATLFVTVP